ncbi:Archaeophage PsiM2, terminase large subunit like protein [Aduncisulcus paluster]|uniref:Archaeophage PsiM2, terminase large subunit like protein n=1 Tax=Aduncisulcus paluster TaxID=2918883 RepID=A0ABQ5KHF4_9EUKA|nr:Archaeophage PsiM2, terminase large subunit like protein [Aduncisulcus paluster]
MPNSNATPTPASRRQDLIRRLLAARTAQDDLIEYIKLSMPDFADRNPNPRSRYMVGRHHNLLAQTLQELEQGLIRRVIVNIGPRHGKTEMASKRFMAWYSARHPDQSLIFGTYNETFAQDVGRAVRDNVTSPEHKLIFPGHTLKEGSQAAQRLETQLGGILAFVGRGGSITGRGGHGIIIDDPIKDRQEADSKLIRDQLWTWFTQVISTRLMTSDSWIMLIQTRWHEDDLVGRLTDPMNAYYDKDEAAQWRVIDLPALAFENEPDILGRKPGEALWPEKFGRKFLLGQQRLDPRGFQALYQGRPSADGGNFFKAEYIKTYKPDELPKNLRIYVASDHAVSTRQDRDKTALIPVGVDERDNIYVLPDVFWRHAAADTTVDAMLKIMSERRPLFWWAERGHITKAIGPFLRKRMAEEGIYASIVELTPIADKQTRAQSIQGRMAMGKVYFPEFAPWWPEARDQLIKFPNGAHDDFVDALAYIGLGLAQQVSAGKFASAKTYGRKGTFRRLFAETRDEARRDAQKQLSNIVDAAPQAAQTDTKIMSRDAPDPVEERAKLVKWWTDQVIAARSYWTDKAFKRMRNDMAFAAGRQWPAHAVDQFVDEAEERYVANITLRHIQARTAAIYGKNPKVVARRKKRLLSTVWDGNAATLQGAMAMLQANPMDVQAQMVLRDAAMTMQEDAKLSKIGQTLELLFEHEIAEQPVPFKVQMKSTVRRGLTTAVGYVKLGYQRVMQRRPDVDGQMHDIGARLATLERLSADLADGEIDQHAKEAEQLRQILESLSQEPEVVVREGLTFHYPDSTSIIPDTNCRQLRGFVGCSFVAEEYFLTSDRIKEIYKVDVKSGGASSYLERSDGEFERGNATDNATKPEHFCVWEVYNKDDGLVYTICDGYKDFLLDPAQPDVWLKRFWPWFAFVVNEVYDDKSVFPPSDVTLMRDMQMELNRDRQGLREHRRANRPKTYTRAGALEKSDKTKIETCQANEVIELQGLQPGEDIRTLLQTHAGVNIDPALYDPGPAFEDYLRVLGQHEASLGGASSGATATEVSVAEGARATTAAAVVDDLDEFLTELAGAAGQILFDEVPVERVKEIVGPGAVWPDLTRDQVADQIYLDVEAASTGRPNKAQEIQNAQQVFPLLMQIPGVSPEWMARELLRRLDDKVDLTDAFAASAPSVMMMNRAQQMAPPEAAGQGNAPTDQGAQGANNAPDTAPPQVNAAPRPGAGQAQMPPL